MNVAFGVIGMTVQWAHPKECPNCKSTKLVKIANGWEAKAQADTPEKHPLLLAAIGRLEAALKEAREERDRWKKICDEGAFDHATLKYLGHTAIPNLTLRLLKERADKAEASLASYAEGARQIAQFTRHKSGCLRFMVVNNKRVLAPEGAYGHDCTCGLAEAILALGTK